MKTIEERAKEYSEDFVNRTPYDVFGDKAYICASEINVSGEVEHAFIAGAKSEHEELTKWNSPECPPEDDKVVIVKYLSRGFELYSIGDYDKNYGWSAQDEAGFYKDNIIGWREIHE